MSPQPELSKDNCTLQEKNSKDVGKPGTEQDIFFNE